MRLVVPACLAILAASATSAFAAYPTPQPAPQERPAPERHAAAASRFLSFRSAALAVDNQVLANLLADVPAHRNDIPLVVVAGEIARCEARACQVPLTVRLEGAPGPVTLSFAVASPKGQISEVQHVECNTTDCTVALILERGANTVSVGVFDPLARATGYATMRVNATRTVADRGKSEWF